MKSILALPLMAGVLLPSAVSAKKEATEPAKRPNVLVIFADDMRADAIHALGNSDIITPNLDRMVASGVTFSNAYLQGANTGGTSVPSRAQLLTGRSLFELPNGDGKSFTPDMKSMATAFAAGGYETHIIGKSHNGVEFSMQGFTGGDRLYGLTKGYYRPHFKMPVQDYREDGKYGSIKNCYYLKSQNPEERVAVTGYSKNKADDDFRGVHSNELFGQAAVDYIKSYDKKNPLFMYLAFHAPHDTRITHDKYHKMYDPSKVSLPANFLPMHPFDNGDLKVRDELLAPFPRTEADTKQQICDYYALITHLDEWIGNVMAALKESGMDENTIVLFAADSGLGLGSHGLFGKQNLYDDGGIRVPLIISGTGIPKGRKSQDLCYTYDIYPTLCDLTSTAIPNSVTGKSFKESILSKKSKGHRDELYFAYRDFQRSVRDSDFKLIEYCVNNERNTQLFAIAKDPDETTDLSKDPKYAAKLQELQAKLREHGKSEPAWGARFWAQYK